MAGPKRPDIKLHPFVAQFLADNAKLRRRQQIDALEREIRGLVPRIAELRDSGKRREARTLLKRAEELNRHLQELQAAQEPSTPDPLK